MFKALSVRVLIALILGLGAGAWIGAQAPGLLEAAGVVESFGSLWLNALRMTVIPLVVSLLIVGIASVADAARTGRLAARAVFVFAVLIVSAALYGAGAAWGIFQLWPVDREAAQALASGATGGPAEARPLDFNAFLAALAPANVVRAAAEDSVLALVVFSIFFGFAATRVAEHLRVPLVGFFTAVSETMLVIVRWILIAAPAGVFALSIGVGLRGGLGAAGVLAHYVIAVSLITFGITLIAFLVAVTWGRQQIGRMAQASTPVWAVAFATQSSLASLPAMLEAARSGLGVRERVADVVLPMAVAIFRITSPVANLGVAFFIAHVMGIEPSALNVAAAIFTAIAVSIASVGLPGQVSFFVSMAPICLALGVPVELLGVLLAVEVVPDIFRTLGNVTGDLTAASVVNRSASARED
ncbi:MAG: dicarboxylate/amino acid:cation symporter [Hyphomonadaceae bacterium]